MRNSSPNFKGRNCHWSLMIPILTVFILITCVAMFTEAQSSSPITPSGLNTQTSGPTTLPNGQTNYDITGGTRPGGATGTNLFHNFGDFNVPTKNIANFLNAGSVDLAGNPLAAGLPTTNILGTVTGVNPSIIFGTIQTNGTGGFGNANLFLMNPNGIIFGPTASLNVGGMATFTTADYVRLTDTGIFYADPAATSVLTSTPVAAFGFLGSNPTAISIQGSTLAVQPGQSISLVGGNQGFTYTNPDTGSTAVPNGVTVTGGHISAREHLLAPGIQVNMISVASPGEVKAETFEYAPNVNGESFGELGTIEVSKKSNIDVSGNGGGTVLIRGGQFVLNNSTISANTTDPGPVTNGAESTGRGIDIVVSQNAKIQNSATIETNVIGNATPGVQYGGVTVKADSVEIADSQIHSDSRNNIGGSSGDITLSSHLDLEITGTTLETDALSGSGNAGNITLTSTYGNVMMNDSFISSQKFPASRGNVGDITVTATVGDIRLIDAVLFTHIEGTGTAAGHGRLQFTANNLTAMGSGIGIDNFSPSESGNLVMNLTDTLRLGGAAQIETTTRGPARSADLNINAHNVLLTDGSVVSTATFQLGPAGTLNIFTENLELTKGSQVTSSSLSTPPDPQSGQMQVIPSGPGGTVKIQGRIGPADSILIDGRGSSISTNTEGTGPGGSTFLSTRSLTIQNDGTISASTSGTAPSATGGSIRVTTTDHVTMTDRASISASSTSLGNAGNISIDAGQQLDLTGNSSITTEAKTASGGDIDIRAIDRVRLVNSSINTSVFGGDGNGGNITIDPNVVVLQGSQVKAEAFQGVGGDITITTPLFLRDSTSEVSALSPFGLNGTVTIQSPTSNLSGSLGPLTSKPSQAQALLTQRCAALAGGQASSFVVAGREQLPTDPGGWLTSPLAFAELGESRDAGHAVASTPANMAIATQGAGTVSLRRLTPSGFLIANFADSEATGCHS